MVIALSIWPLTPLKQHTYIVQQKKKSCNMSHCCNVRHCESSVLWDFQILFYASLLLISFLFFFIIYLLTFYIVIYRFFKVSKMPDVHPFEPHWYYASLSWLHLPICSILSDRPSLVLHLSWVSLSSQLRCTSQPSQWWVEGTLMEGNVGFNWTFMSVSFCAHALSLFVCMPLRPCLLSFKWFRSAHYTAVFKE